MYTSEYADSQMRKAVGGKPSKKSKYKGKMKPRGGKPKTAAHKQYIAAEKKKKMTPNDPMF